MPSLDRKDHLPVFNQKSKPFKRFTKKYLKISNMKLIFNNSITDTYVRYGILHNETFHSLIKRKNYVSNWQSIKLMYQRCDTLFLCVNIGQIEFFNNLLFSKYGLIYHEMLQIINNLFGLHFIKNSNYPMVPHIKVNKEEINQVIAKKVERDQLQFKCPYKKWSKKETAKLKQLIFHYNLKNINDDMLNQLYNDFDKKFSRKHLRGKCFKFGLNFVLN